ncbi:hypothetical protein Cgig2_007383 [Carnegiea gigantea]|uniref:Exostosin GT47 domain-containing protein n=1 Tax=Carnegiea gigantea TaxID=171969 RepID=A0A9Q1KZG4_9CARY|nr:hypothetical protein Cgig2_007383 [Carnegiea gigantea]
MSTVKPPHSPPSSSTMLTLRWSLLTLALVALICFTFLSLKSLQFTSPSFSFSHPTLKVADDDGELLSEVYHTPEIFRLTYAEMERRFKAYIYPDGDPNNFYQTKEAHRKNIRESRFRTDDPEKAHMFFIPISCHGMRGKGTSYEHMTIIVRDYVESLISKYPYWNRTLGADHFFVTYHDVGVRATERTNLGFWAGHPRVWGNDTELDISNNRINRATEPLLYQKRFYRNKSAYVLVALKLIVPASWIPFTMDVFLSKFAVILRERDVYQLKQILKNISDAEFARLHMNMVKVQKRFQCNTPPVKFDAFHTVMYELWLQHRLIKY